MPRQTGDEIEAPPPKFAKTFCSQCGGEFGPGDSGYSHCADHDKERHAKAADAIPVRHSDSLNLVPGVLCGDYDWDSGVNAPPSSASA
jgi:hypothetical protein